MVPLAFSKCLILLFNCKASKNPLLIKLPRTKVISLKDGPWQIPTIHRTYYKKVLSMCIEPFPNDLRIEH